MESPSTRRSRESHSVFLVDDDVRILDQLSEYLQSQGYRTQTFSSGEELLSSLSDDDRGCVVIDIMLTGMSGLQLQETLNQRPVKLPVIILSGHGNVPMTVRAMKNGAVVCLEKPIDFKLLDRALQEALQVESEWHDFHQRHEVFLRRYRQLNEREREVFRHLVDGLGNKEIAQQLEIGLRTVERARQIIFRKTNVETLAELVKFSVALHEPPESSIRCGKEQA